MAESNEVPQAPVKYPVNTWEQVNHGDVFLSFSKPPARTMRVPCWRVNRKGFQTDPTAPWYDGGCKTFSAYREKAKALEDAKEWAGKRYGITNWVKNGQGDYVNGDAGYLPLALEVERKAARAAKRQTMKMSKGGTES